VNLSLVVHFLFVGEAQAWQSRVRRLSAGVLQTTGRVTSRSQATLSPSWRLYPALRSVAQGCMLVGAGGETGLRKLALDERPKSPHLG